MNRWGLRSATACAALAAAFIACSSTPDLNAPLGNCVGTPDAACSVGIPTGGSVGVPDASGFDASVDATVLPPDSGICGLDAVLAASSMRTFPNCNACIFASPCCMSETTCSNDSVCAAIISCVNVAGCTDANCVNVCVDQWAPNGNQNFADFAQCATGSCAFPQCTFLSPIVGDL